MYIEGNNWTDRPMWNYATGTLTSWNGFSAGLRYPTQPRGIAHPCKLWNNQNMKKGELQTSWPSASHVKGFWENYIQTNKYLHGRQTIKMFDRFQKISLNPTFACNHAWKVKKSNWQGKLCFCIIFRSLRRLWHNYDLVPAKLKAYRFSPYALKLMHSYLNNRKQQVQISNRFSSKSAVIAGVSQGSIDGLLLFNLFINGLVFFIQCCTLSNYADDNNLFSMGKNKSQVKTFLSSDFKIINNWFYVLKPRKSLFICVLVKKLMMLKLSILITWQ